MAEQENECYLCDGVLRDPVTSGHCHHRFCKDCLREFADEERLRQGVEVTRRCSSCHRPCLHNTVNLNCPVCQTPFRYKEPLLGEFNLQSLMVSQILIALVFFGLYFRDNNVFMRAWVLQFFCITFGAGLYTFCRMLMEIKYYRLCCHSRMISMILWLSMFFGLGFGPLAFCLCGGNSTLVNLLDCAT